MTEQKALLSQSESRGRKHEKTAATAKSPCMKLCRFEPTRSHEMRGLFVPRPVSQPEPSSVGRLQSTVHTNIMRVPLIANNQAVVSFVSYTSP